MSIDVVPCNRRLISSVYRLRTRNRSKLSFSSRSEFMIDSSWTWMLSATKRRDLWLYHDAYTIHG